MRDEVGLADVADRIAVAGGDRPRLHMSQYEGHEWGEDPEREQRKQHAGFVELIGAVREGDRAHGSSHHGERSQDAHHLDHARIAINPHLESSFPAVIQ